MQNAVVIGTPINHSKSPLIHRFWLKQYGVEATYTALEVPLGNLAQFSSDMARGKFIGANVTLPHKTTILTYCDQTTKIARQIGAVNTLYVRNGQLIGDNTDAYGFLANLDQQSKGWDNNLSQVILLGAGGACRAVLSALLSREVGQIVVLNRTLQNATNLIQWFEKFSRKTRLSADLLENYKNYAPNTNMLINTSSVGLNGTRFDTLNPSELSKDAIVHDIVYSPLQTPLLADAKIAGLKTADGLGMLLHQAVPGFEKWFGLRPQVTSELYQLVAKTLQ